MGRPHLQPKPSSGFMSRRQVCEEFGFSESFLDHIPRNVLPRYEFGGKLFLDRQEVIAAIKGRATRPQVVPDSAPKLRRKSGRPPHPPINER